MYLVKIVIFAFLRAAGNYLGILVAGIPGR
jgi:hypothetical protein